MIGNNQENRLNHQKTSDAEYKCNNAKDAYCKVFSWVASKIIFGALPTFSASSQREIHKHHLFPEEIYLEKVSRLV